jgi:hypothetical protein
MDAPQFARIGRGHRRVLNKYGDSSDDPIDTEVCNYAHALRERRWSERLSYNRRTRKRRTDPTAITKLAHTTNDIIEVPVVGKLDGATFSL